MGPKKKGSKMNFNSRLNDITKENKVPRERGKRDATH